MPLSRGILLKDGWESLMYRSVCIAAVSLSIVLAGCGKPHKNPRTARATPSPSSPNPSSTSVAAPSAMPRPAPANSMYDISIDQLRSHVNTRSAVVLDARTPAQFAQGHVRGALNMPANRPEPYLA